MTFSSSDFLLVLDQGTTGTTAAFFSATNLRYACGAKQEFPQIYPQPGFVEHDVDSIWQSTMCALRDAKKALPNGAKIVCMGITNQRETVVAWNKKTGAIAGNAIVWQDRRTAEFCDTLKADKKIREMISKKTGLVCDPYFSASKMRWMMQNYPACKTWAQSGELAFGTIDSYLIYRLTAGKSFATEHTNASRTMLYNLETGDYDEELLSLFGIKREMLADVQASSSSFGICEGIENIPNGTPILGCLGDQQAALFGQDATREGEAKITFGTGAFLLMHTGSKPFISQEGLLTTAAYSYRNKRNFALEGAAFIAGAAVQFLRDHFKWIKDSAEVEALAKQDKRDNNLLFVPAFAGLGSPYWNPNAKAVLFGMTRGSTQSQIARAVLESIGLQNVQLLRLMQRASGAKLSKVGVDGKAALNDFLIQFQSDSLQTRLVRPENIDTTAKGAARAALVTLTDDEKVAFGETTTDFVPKMLEKDSEALVSEWIRAAQCVNQFYSSTM